MELHWMEDDWKIPSDDMSKVYASMGYTEETPEKIDQCTTIMYVGSLLEHYYAGIITRYYENHSAFLTEEADTWYHGGFSDMADNV